MSGGSGTRKGSERQGQTLQPKDYEWEVPEETESSDVGRDEETKVDEDGGHSQCGRGRQTRRHPGGFSSSRGKPPLHQHEQSRGLLGLSQTDCP